MPLISPVTEPTGAEDVAAVVAMVLPPCRYPE
jgi:hypothetical protein